MRIEAGLSVKPRKSRKYVNVAAALKICKAIIGSDIPKISCFALNKAISKSFVQTAMQQNIQNLPISFPFQNFEQGSKREAIR